MAKNDRTTPATSPEAVISIIGVGMTVTGDIETDGALRIEGTVNGSVRAGKAVVIGKEGLVDGNIYTQDAVIAGRVLGSLNAVSRLELQSTSHISGEIEARRMQLEEGATVQGQVSVGESQAESLDEPSTREKAGSQGTPEGGGGGGAGAKGATDAPAPSGKARGGAVVASASPRVLGSAGSEGPLSSPGTSSPVASPGRAPGTRPHQLPSTSPREASAGDVPPQPPNTMPT